MATIANKILLCRRLAPKCRHFSAYKSRISNANTVARNYECFRRCKIYNNDLNERFLSSDGSSGLPADEQNMTLSLSHNCVKVGWKQDYVAISIGLWFLWSNWKQSNDHENWDLVLGYIDYQNCNSEYYYKLMCLFYQIKL